MLVSIYLVYNTVPSHNLFISILAEITPSYAFKVWVIVQKQFVLKIKTSSKHYWISLKQNNFIYNKEFNFIIPKCLWFYRFIGSFLK